MSGLGSFAESHHSRTSAFVCTSSGCAASSSARSSVMRWSSVAIGLRISDLRSARDYDRVSSHPFETRPGQEVRMDRHVAVVTGANKGIGLEIARQLAREGIAVFI